MKKLKYLMILIIVIYYAQVIQSVDEIFELGCDHENQCKQFEHSGVKSFCREDECHCTLNGENVKCQPSNLKLNNIIGGPCPCRIPNGAECDKKHNICYCVKKFRPSRDKRRCIPKIVALGGVCEETSQCQKTDVFAVCHAQSQKCKCVDRFVSENGHCLSLVGNKSSPPNDTQGVQEYDNNTHSDEDDKRYVCRRGYFASIDNSVCLKVAKYLHNCTDNLQCIGSMGLGGICVENVCKCAEKYFLEHIKYNENDNETVCSRVKQRGDYCYDDKGCYQRQLKESDQSMFCFYGECDCKEGFHSFNNSPCFKTNRSYSSRNYRLFNNLQIVCLLPFALRYKLITFLL